MTARRTKSRRDGSVGTRSGPALSAVSFDLADVSGRFGPFPGIVLTGTGWSAPSVGPVPNDGGLVGMIATTPGDWHRPPAMFARMTIMAVGSLVAPAMIRPGALDPVAARGPRLHEVGRAGTSEGVAAQDPVGLQ